MKLQDILGYVLYEYSFITIFSTTAIFLIMLKSISVTQLAPVIIIATCGSFLFNSVNNIFDIEIDSIGKPKRALAKKTLSVSEAWIITVILYIIMIFTSLFLSYKIVIISQLYIVAAIIYSVPPLRIKRFPLGDNIISGTIYGIAPFLLIYLNFDNLIFPSFFFLAFLIMFFSLASIKDLEDLEVDSRFGIHSLALILGYKSTLRFILISYFVALLIILTGISLGALSQVYIWVFILALFLVLVMAKYFNVTPKRNESVITQAQIVTKAMILTIVIQLLFGITSLYI